VLFFRLFISDEIQKPALAGNLPKRKNPDQSVFSTIRKIGMAYIKEHGAYWRAEVCRKGYLPLILNVIDST